MQPGSARTRNADFVDAADGGGPAAHGGTTLAVDARAGAEMQTAEQGDAVWTINLLAEDGAPWLPPQSFQPGTCHILWHSSTAEPVR